MTFRITLLRSALILAFVAAATPSLRYFHYTRAVYPPPANAGQTCATLDAEVFSQSGPNLASLRLYQGDALHPYAVINAAPLGSTGTWLFGKNALVAGFTGQLG